MRYWSMLMVLRRGLWLLLRCDRLVRGRRRVIGRGRLPWRLEDTFWRICQLWRMFLSVWVCDVYLAVLESVVCLACTSLLALYGVISSKHSVCQIWNWIFYTKGASRFSSDCIQPMHSILFVVFVVFVVVLCTDIYTLVCCMIYVHFSKKTMKIRVWSYGDSYVNQVRGRWISLCLRLRVHSMVSDLKRAGSSNSKLWSASFARTSLMSLNRQQRRYI